MKSLRGWRAAILTILIAGCSEAVPTQPEPQYAKVPGEVPGDVSRVAVYRSEPPSHRNSVSSWIGPAGGTLRVLDVEIVIPPGAVSEPTRFRIRLPGDPKARLALAELQPHGMIFLQQVTVRLPYRGTDAEGQRPSVIWWNGASWVRLPTTLRPDGRIQTQTTHFSFFGTERFLIGITPVGG